MSNNTEYRIQNTKYRKGFTLIEMLIVITIIAVLASMILVGMGGARAKSRDARRIADLHNVMNALELYYSLKGSYLEGTYNSVAHWESFAATLTEAGIGVSRIPKDPLNSTEYYYRYSGTTTNYVLGAALEQADISLNDDIDSEDLTGTGLTMDCGSGDSTTDKIYCIMP
jgi:prepilin-type N-terminal cleavage/methylation domain-containing protein